VTRRDRAREIAVSGRADRSFRDLVVIAVFIGIVILGLLWFAGAGFAWSTLVAAEFVLFVLAVSWWGRRRRRREEGLS
jgi:hypothetical protein